MSIDDTELSPRAIPPLSWADLERELAALWGPAERAAFALPTIDFDPQLRAARDRALQCSIATGTSAQTETPSDDAAVQQ